MALVTISDRKCKSCGATHYSAYSHNPGTCRECYAARCSRWRTQNRRRNLDRLKEWAKKQKRDSPVARWCRVNWNSCKKRAAKCGVPFAITYEQLLASCPRFCPALGIELCYTNSSIQANSPSIDRYIPQRGYQLDNITVVSNLANRIKTNANKEQVLAVAEWMEKCESSKRKK